MKKFENKGNNMLTSSSVMVTENLATSWPWSTQRPDTSKRSQKFHSYEDMSQIGNFTVARRDCRLKWSHCYANDGRTSSAEMSSIVAFPVPDADAAALDAQVPSQDPRLRRQRRWATGLPTLQDVRLSWNQLHRGHLLSERRGSVPCELCSHAPTSETNTGFRSLSLAFSAHTRWCLRRLGASPLPLHRYFEGYHTQ